MGLAAPLLLKGIFGKTVMRGFMFFFQKIIYLEKKVEHLSKISMASKLKGHIWFYYLLTETRLTRNTLRIQSDNSVTCGFYCIAFIEYMITEKMFLDNNNLFSSNDYKKNDKICKYFKEKYDRRKLLL